MTTTFDLYSGVLGGAKVVELDGNGAKTKGYVYANGVRLAKQEMWSNAVIWNHPNPGSNSWVETRSDRFATRQEMDPVGAEVGTDDPFVSDPDPNYLNLKGTEPLYIDGGDPFDYSGGSTLDGLPMTGSQLNRIRRDVGVSGIMLVDVSVPFSLMPDHPNEISVPIAGTLGILLPNTPERSQSAQQTSRKQQLINDTRNNLIALLNYKDPNGNNPCADFFGGAKNAIAALNAIPFTPGKLNDYTVGIGMKFTNATVIPGTTYIVPSSAIVNTEGGFYDVWHIDKSTSKPLPVPGFGTLGAGNNRSRALQMLHELGHTIVTGIGPNGALQLLLQLDDNCAGSACLHHRSFAQSRRVGLRSLKSTTQYQAWESVAKKELVRIEFRSF